MNKCIFTKMVFILISAAMIILTGVYVLRSEESKWELLRESDGIQVFSRMKEGSQIIEFKGVSRENADIDTIAAILLDIASYPSWIEYIKESKIIKRTDVDNFYVYQRFKFFWPYNDRDIVVKVTIDRRYGEGILHADMRAVQENMYPVQKDCIRMKEMSGEITVKYVSAGVTEGNFSERFSPGGRVPDWLAKKINEYIPLVVLTKLKEEAKKRTVSDKRSIADEIEKAMKAKKAPK
jgi:START domain